MGDGGAKPACEWCADGKYSTGYDYRAGQYDACKHCGGGAKTPEEVAAALVAKFAHDAEHFALGWNPIAGKGLEDDLRAMIATAIREATGRALSPPALPGDGGAFASWLDGGQKDWGQLTGIQRLRAAWDAATERAAGELERLEYVARAAILAGFAHLDDGGLGTREEMRAELNRQQAMLDEDARIRGGA